MLSKFNRSQEPRFIIKEIHLNNSPVRVDLHLY
uniref:Uncharacterized protein n=1 Tax=Ascaris lumbricoides TaxID=6252 RepID=A0A0M3I3X9_ASCLU